MGSCFLLPDGGIAARPWEMSVLPLHSGSWGWNISVAAQSQLLSSNSNTGGVEETRRAAGWHLNGSCKAALEGGREAFGGGGDSWHGVLGGWHPSQLKVEELEGCCRGF